jgi:undecaprenyl-phosphate 4-deoxy-4-formamido-L-arabinose transferase
MNISVIVPVYNSENSLSELYKRLTDVMESIADGYEIIMVNDGSHDASWDVITGLAKHSETLKGINLMRNFGQHNALLSGINVAQHEIIVTIDDDLQNPPEEIPKLIDKLKEGYDVVYGTPEQERHGLWRDIASKVTKILLKKSMGVETARDISAFRVFRGNISRAFSHYRGPFVALDVLLSWGTTRFTSILVSHEKRRMGASNYTLLQLITHTFNMVTGFSALPLRIASVLGFFFAIFGFVVMGYVLIRYLWEGSNVPGFPFLASLVSIFAGVQLFSLGMIGEYLLRMHFRLMDRPYSVMRGTVGFESGKEDLKNE